MVTGDWEAHELVWLTAAMQMVGQERIFAVRDISAMTGRMAIVIEDKLALMEMERAAALVLLQYARIQSLRAAAGRREPRVQVKLPPSQLKQPTKAQMMARR